VLCARRSRRGSRRKAEILVRASMSETGDHRPKIRITKGENWDAYDAMADDNSPERRPRTKPISSKLKKKSASKRTMRGEGYADEGQTSGGQERKNKNGLSLNRQGYQWGKWKSMIVPSLFSRDRRDRVQGTRPATKASTYGGGGRTSSQIPNHHWGKLFHRRGV